MTDDSSIDSNFSIGADTKESSPPLRRRYSSPLYEAELPPPPFAEAEEEPSTNHYDADNSERTITTETAAAAAAVAVATSPTTWATTTAPIELRPEDVICTKGRITRNHPGNVKYDSLIQHSRDRYQACQFRGDKTRITNDVIESVKQAGGRFLKYDTDTGVWIELTRALEREKVSHALRSSKSPLVQKQQRKGIAKSTPSSSPNTSQRSITVPAAAAAGTPPTAASSSSATSELLNDEKIRAAYELQQQILRRFQQEEE